MSAEDIWPPRQRLVGVWLLVICVLVFAMIMVGGATRLTDSGLSITEWNFMKHVIPPMGDAAWQQEFSLYQRTMEYQAQNNGMSDRGIPSHLLVGMGTSVSWPDCLASCSLCRR